MWTESQSSETRGAESRTLLTSGDKASPMKSRSIGTVGIWIEGVDRLGAAYEGIWRVIKRFIISSDGTRTRFRFVAPARFASEIREFLSDLPPELCEKVEIDEFGSRSDVHDANEAVRQASFANNIEVDTWLVPNPMWSSAKYLIRPKLVWFHDFLLVEFPQSYPRKLFLEFQSNVKDFVSAGAFFIFTSPYVKEKHGHEFCGIPREQSALILNSPIDGLPALEGASADPRDAGDFIRDELKENLRRWCSPAHAELFFHHISSYPFEKVPYFFVSSQNREHKGFLRLAQAHAALLRERYFQYSIFTTALVDVAGSSALEQFLRAKLLLGDFMSVGKVSETTHALLYKFARLTIHPSTFEGNLPLPFAESVSVGTPCIMPYSRAYADYLDPALHPWVFYNATQTGLIDKVAEVEERRSDFISAQRDVLSQLRKHSLKDFFKLHAEAFDKAREVKPQSAEFVVTSRQSSFAPIRKGLLKGLFAAPSNEASADTGSLIQTRLWSSFELERSAEADGEDAPALHWAAYLGSNHPKGDSYFLAGIGERRPTLNPADLGLFAEVGSWLNNEYRVADSHTFRFDGLEGLPQIFREVAQQTGVVAALGGAQRIGWVRLIWNQGIIPELRIGGKALKSGSAVSARAASLFRSPTLHPDFEQSLS